MGQGLTWQELHGAVLAGISLSRYTLGLTRIGRHFLQNLTTHSGTYNLLWVITIQYTHTTCA